MDSQFNCLTNRENMCPSKIFKHTVTKLKSIVRIPQEKATALSTDREEKATASVSLRGGVPTLEATGRGQLLHVNFSKDAPNITFFSSKQAEDFQKSMRRCPVRVQKTQQCFSMYCTGEQRKRGDGHNHIEGSKFAGKGSATASGAQNQKLTFPGKKKEQRKFQTFGSSNPFER
jgi:hypothetical protein